MNKAIKCIGNYFTESEANRLIALNLIKKGIISQEELLKLNVNMSTLLNMVNLVPAIVNKIPSKTDYHYNLTQFGKEYLDRNLQFM